uniref:hypothetical protein n=1 Tax=[Mycoplasma] collis TaxID=2127 RepID=UPI00051B6B99
DGAYKITKIAYEGDWRNSSFGSQYHLRNTTIFDNAFAQSNMKFGYSEGSWDTSISLGNGKDNSKVTLKLTNYKNSDPALKLINPANFDFYAKVADARHYTLSNGTNGQFSRVYSYKTIQVNNRVVNTNGLSNDIIFDAYDAIFTNNKFIIDKIIIVPKGQTFSEAMFNTNNTTNNIKVRPSTNEHNIASQVPFYDFVGQGVEYLTSTKHNDGSIDVETFIYSNDGVFSTNEDQMRIEAELFEQNGNKVQGVVDAKILSIENNRKRAKIKLTYDNSKNGNLLLRPQTRYSIRNVKIIYPQNNHNYADDTKGRDTIANMGANNKQTNSTTINHNFNVFTHNRLFNQSPTDNTKLFYRKYGLAWLYRHHINNENVVAHLDLHRDRIDLQWKPEWNNKKLEVVYRLYNRNNGWTQHVIYGQIDSDTFKFDDASNRGFTTTHKDIWSYRINIKRNSIWFENFTKGYSLSESDKYAIEEIRLYNPDGSLYLRFNTVEEPFRKNNVLFPWR